MEGWDDPLGRPVSRCAFCQHLAYDITYTDEDHATGRNQASGFGHGLTGDRPCKCGCTETPEVTKYVAEIAWRQKVLERALISAKEPWTPMPTPLH